MSKTAQRKRSAYQAGYNIGRYGWPPGVKGYTVRKSADESWHRGLRDGRRDKKKQANVRVTWLQWIINLWRSWYAKRS